MKISRLSIIVVTAISCALLGLAPGCGKSKEKSPDPAANGTGDQASDQAGSKTGEQASNQAGSKTGEPDDSAGSGSGQGGNGTGKSGMGQNQDGEGGASGDKILFRDGGGTEAFAIIPREDGAKIVDATDEKVARLRLSDDKLEVKGPGKNVIAHAGGSGDRYTIEDGEQKEALYEYTRQKDGNYKVEDNTGTVLYEVIKRDYGLEIQDTSKASIYRIEVEERGGATLYKADGTKVYTTQSEVSIVAIACLGFHKMSLPVRIGLLWQVHKSEQAAKAAPEKP